VSSHKYHNFVSLFALSLYLFRSIAGAKQCAFPNPAKSGEQKCRVLEKVGYPRSELYRK
jgi:hypothetical protein